MKRIPLGVVKVGRHPNQQDRKVSDILLDCLYAPTQMGVNNQVGRARVKVGNLIEKASEQPSVMLEDADHATLVAAINGFVSVCPDEGLYAAQDLALNAETVELPN
jgi:hypothetical protein